MYRYDNLSMNNLILSVKDILTITANKGKF
jgi:hypothetical protein